MPDLEPHEQLKSARIALGLDHAVVARRTGIREPLIDAMETGRWERLPHGLYARAAVRSYAGFLGLDADAIVRACEASLPGLEDPIAGLARVRGLKSHAPRAVSTAGRMPAAPTDAALKCRAAEPDAGPRTSSGVATSGRSSADGPSWDARQASRAVLSLAIDSAVIAAPLLLAIFAAAAMNRIPPSALRYGASSFGAFGAIIAALYFFCFAGVGGCTVGERVTGAPHDVSPGLDVTLHGVRIRTAAAAFRGERRCCQWPSGRSSRSSSRRCFGIR